MNERLALELAVQREPKSLGARKALVDWLMENNEYDRRQASKIVARIAMCARDERRLRAAHTALSGRSVFCTLLKQILAEKTSMSYGDAFIMTVVPGYRLPHAKREAVGMPFLDQHVHHVWVGANWVMREVLAAIRFHTMLPMMTDPEELTNFVNEFGARGRAEQLDQEHAGTTSATTAATNL